MGLPRRIVPKPPSVRTPTHPHAHPHTHTPICSLQCIDAQTQAIASALRAPRGPPTARARAPCVGPWVRRCSVRAGRSPFPAGDPSWACKHTVAPSRAHTAYILAHPAGAGLPLCRTLSLTPRTPAQSFFLCCLNRGRPRPRHIYVHMYAHCADARRARTTHARCLPISQGDPNSLSLFLFSLGPLPSPTPCSAPRPRPRPWPWPWPWPLWDRFS